MLDAERAAFDRLRMNVVEAAGIVSQNHQVQKALVLYVE